MKRYRLVFLSETKRESAIQAVEVSDHADNVFQIVLNFVVVIDEIKF